MENLPANRTTSAVSANASNGRGLSIWSASSREIADALSAPGVSLEWITGRMTVIEATHFVPPMTDMEHDAWVRSYYEAVSDLPAPFVHEAFDHVSRTLARKPTPADIRNRAVSQIGEARQRRTLDRTPEFRPEPRPEGPPISDEDRERIVAQARRAAAKLRWRKTHGRSDPEEVPAKPRRLSDREIQGIIAANPARYGQTVEQFRAAEEGQA